MADAVKESGILEVLRALLAMTNQFVLTVNGVTVPLDDSVLDELWDLAHRSALLELEHQALKVDGEA